MKMMRMNRALIPIVLSALFTVPVGSEEVLMPDAARLDEMAARFAPVEIAADLSRLPDSERKALGALVRASSIMDALFLRQVWAGNEAMLIDLLKDDSAVGKRRLHYFLVNKGPWSRLDHNRAFVPGAPPKPESANFYPAGSSKAEIESWLATLSAAERQQAMGFFSTIRRGAGSDRAFQSVPYSVEYQGELAEAALLLNEAAALTSQPTLKAYLTKRAAAFLSNDYYESDLAWMELDSSIEPTIGPYEVYEDEWFNAKAAFESFITVRDDVETAKLSQLGSRLQDIENHLPVDPKHRNPKLGALAPIRVVNEVLAAGDGNHGVQTAAFNLPNDERVIREKGAKRVMLKNVQEAKFRIVLVPISKTVLGAADRRRVSFDAFFIHIVMHELMHGLGPHDITVAGRQTTVRQELRELYSAIEEAKADISGLFALQYLIDEGVLDRGLEESIYDTYLASAFRSIRFGINEAHGRGQALQLNFLLDHGAVEIGDDGAFSVNRGKIKAGVKALTSDILTIEAEGDYRKAKQLLDALAVIRPSVRKALDSLQDVPVDIAPRFITAQALMREYAK